MVSVENFILNREGNQKEILLILHDFIVNIPKIEAKYRFKIPFYFRNRWVCYLNPIKDDGIELVFLNGKKMKDRLGLLEDRGRKMVAGIRIYDPIEIPLESIASLLEEAFVLDDLA